MKRLLSAVAVVAGLAFPGAGLAQTLKPQRGGDRVGARPRIADAAPDVVVQWNQELLSLLQVPGAQPATIHPIRTIAIVQLAVYDAVNAIEGGHHAYLPLSHVPAHASPEAAVDAAARTTLLALLPTQAQPINTMYQQTIAQLGSSRSVSQGISVGDRAAQAILNARANDGSAAAPPPFTAGTAPGAYQPTPPTFTPPVFGQWGNVTPFALRSGSQFRPPPPPTLDSSRYVDDFNEVKALGRIDSTARSAEETNIGKFWGAAPIWIVWNQIADMAAAGLHTTLTQNARLFALLDAGLADSVIALYDAKYTYLRWRPVTAITAVDTGNPLAISDPTWTPLAATAPDPSYPGAHATVSETAAVTLADFFGTDNFAFSLSNAKLPGVVRTFESFSQAADEASASRIFAGQHSRYDEDAGVTLGQQVGDYLSDNLLLATPVDRGTRPAIRHRHHNQHHHH